MTVTLWLVAGASLLATWLNIHRRRACFAIWAVTNAAWTVADYRAGLLPQAALQAVYFGLALYGFARWRRDGVQHHEPGSRRDAPHPASPTPREAPS